jgi:hypothetical protein
MAHIENKERLVKFANAGTEYVPLNNLMQNID